MGYFLIITTAFLPRVGLSVATSTSLGFSGAAPSAPDFPLPGTPTSFVAASPLPLLDWTRDFEGAGVSETCEVTVDPEAVGRTGGLATFLPFPVPATKLSSQKEILPYSLVLIRVQVQVPSQEIC